MSVLNQSGEEQVECPLCMEPLEVDDLHFYPCTCGYQICRFCWNRIREGENGLCPACRKAYPENPADFTPLSQEQVAAMKTEKKAREQKKRNKTLESRRALANVRVVQNNLVFVVGLPVRLADPEILKRQEYFGKYGKIHKVVINQSTTYAGSQGPSASAYVTYLTSADALRAIQGVNNVTLDGRVLKSSLGTTKYCANFMKNQPCPKPDCMYLHELGDPKASFTKEEMHAGLHQVYERKLHTQLLQRERGDALNGASDSAGNSSTNPEKGSSKEGNQSNFIPTTVVTSSNINVVNTSRSKKDTVNGNNTNGNSTNGNSNGTSSNGSSSSGSSGNGKEAWPSLGSTPPNDSPIQKNSNKTQTVKSQENGTPEANSPTQTPTQEAQTRQDTKSKKDKKKNDKSKQTNSISSDASDPENMDTYKYEIEQENFMNNEIDELESDRHSLLENHDLLDNSEHALLEDTTHNLLKDANNEVLLMQKQREMLANLVDNMKSPLNGYMDREPFSDRAAMNHGLLDKEMLMRERGRSEMLMRNEMMARQALMEQKHFMPNSSIAIDSANDLLGANFHSNHNMLPPFGMRVDNSLGASNMGINSLSANSLGANTRVVNSLGSSTMSVNSLGSTTMNGLGSNMVNSMGVNSMAGGMSNPMANNMSPFLLHNQQMMQNQQQLQHGLVNGFDGAQNSNNMEGRYVSENMDKFFTDFHKAQQMRMLINNRDHSSPLPMPRQVINDRMDHHQQRMNPMRVAGAGEGHGSRATDDDDLDFDPFKETQKAFAEMMETELKHNTVSGGDNSRRSRLAPPGFAPTATPFPRHQPHNPHTHHQIPTQGYASGSAMYSDWTQMDPAIMSTSVNFGKPQQPQQPPQQQQQHHDIFSRFNHLNIANVNGAKLPTMSAPPSAASTGLWGNANSHKIWTNSGRGPLPPGFAPNNAGECIDAK